MRWYKNPKLWMFVAVSAIILIVAGLTAGGRTALTPVEFWTAEFLTPLQAGVNRVVDKVLAPARSLVRLGQLEKENAELRDRLSEIEERLNELVGADLENRRLRQLLGLGQKVEYPHVAAEVIARNPDYWFKTVVINRGSRDGIRPDHVVVTAEGLVGRVMNTTLHSSRIMLISDPESGVGATIRRTRDSGVIVGDGRELVMKFFSPEARPVTGDVIVTSGLGRVFPEGLVIGTVSGFKDEGMSKTAVVTPAVDLERIEEVVVLLVPRPEGEMEP